ncbi:MAG: ATP-binding protein [Lachnospiraceae bacterium]|nr:ATP-binding protein [Lachnospiraceae bacterium]
MKPINIFALTRIEDPDNIARFEKQMSQRSRRISVKKWEVSTLTALVAHLSEVMPDAAGLEFYYSFTIPHLGKEFDLLRVSRQTVINVELKSGEVTDEAIKRQLLQNRHYLNTLGRNVRSYTYVEADDRLVRLTGGDRLVDESFEVLAADLAGQSDIFENDAELLFQEAHYLIEPLKEPDRFLRREYFLTAQQKDIEKRILKSIETTGSGLYSFTGYPGTGKSMLLFDLALQLSEKKRVCLIYGDTRSEALAALDERLHRVDIVTMDCDEEPCLEDYAVLLIDEAHRLKAADLTRAMNRARELELPLIMTYDTENAVSVHERPVSPAELAETQPDMMHYKLTNRIRANSELSTFIQKVMNPAMYVAHASFPSVAVYYAPDETAGRALLTALSQKDFVTLDSEAVAQTLPGLGGGIAVKDLKGAAFEKVAMVLDASFYYDDDRYLRYRNSAAFAQSPVRELFRGLNRAREAIALVVVGNEVVFDVLMEILQG